MALRFTDSFDHYATADLTKKWTSYVSSADIVAGGRNGSCVRLIGGNILKTLDSQATWIVGFAFRAEEFLPSTRILRFVDEATVHFALYVNQTSGTISAARDTTVLATSVNSLQASTWYYIEAKVTIGDAGVGNYEVRVNGTSTGWLPSTVADTRNGANATANVVIVSGMASATSYLDDLYIADGTAGINDFIGDVRINYYGANATGNYAQMTCSTGADHDALVDEAAQDGDTTYVYSSTAGQKDTFQIADTSAATILGVQQVCFARKDDSGARTIRNICRNGGTDYNGATESPGVSYLCFRTIRETDPATGAAWGSAGFNAAEWGVEVVA